MSIEAVTQLIARTRRTARFIRAVHSSSFDPPYPGEPFHYVSLYDEGIGSNILFSKTHGTIVVENTYLSSFAYNLMLAWIFERGSVVDAAVVQTGLLKYNLKRFFAEQLLRARNCVVSRAIFLETLLFEQHSMVSVFETAGRIPQINNLINPAIDTMTQITRLHELTHHYLTLAGSNWGSLMGDSCELSSLVDELVGGDTHLAIETRCDVVAVIHDFQRCVSGVERIAALRAAVFGHAAYAAMMSLERSAVQTIRDHYSSPDVVDLKSTEPIGGMYSLSMVPHGEIIQRARVVLRVCEELAPTTGFDLYGDHTALSFGPSVIDDMLGYIDEILLNDDQNARDMSLLVATAFEGNSDGFEFLRIHSKRFRPKPQGAYR